jgi:hypothetical protein
MLSSSLIAVISTAVCRASSQVQFLLFWGYDFTENGGAFGSARATPELSGTRICKFFPCYFITQDLIHFLRRRPLALKQLQMVRECNRNERFGWTGKVVNYPVSGCAVTRRESVLTDRVSL